MSTYQPVPVLVASQIGEQFAKDQVIVLAWDAASGLVHTTTWGRSEQDKWMAAQGGERIAEFLALDRSREERFEDFREWRLLWAEIAVLAAVEQAAGGGSA